MIITFLRDNASLIAFIALLFTIANFIYVYLKDKENNRRWEAMNLARIVIRNLRLQTWRELTRETFLTTKWGYDDAFAVIPVDDLGLMQHDKYLASAAIIAVRSDSSVFDGPNAITVQELTSQIIARDDDPRNYQFLKLFRVIFALENTGTTAASDMEIQVSLHDGESTITGPTTGSPQTLQPGELTWTTSNIRMALNERLSSKFRLDISISFIDINQKKHRFKNSFLFDRSTATFRRT